MKTKKEIIHEFAQSLNLDELDLFNNSLNEILNGPDAIDDWEFQTRTGVERQEAEKLLKKVGTAIDEITNAERLS